MALQFTSQDAARCLLQSEKLEKPFTLIDGIAEGGVIALRWRWRSDNALPISNE